MCGRIGIISASEVAVVAGDDGVGFTLLDILPVPLANAGTTGIGQHQCPNLSERFVLEWKS